MLCPRCSLKLGVQDRICPRCCYFMETGETLDVHPPRAAAAKPFGVLSFTRARQLHGTGGIVRDANPAHLVLALFPGLGHVAAGRVATALCYTTAWAAVVGSAFYLKDVTGQVLLTLAAFVHAHSIYDLLPLPDGEDAFIKGRKSFFIVLVVLMFGVYWPVSEWLGWVEPQVMGTTRGMEWAGHIVFFFWMGIFGFGLYAASYIFFNLLGRILSIVLPKKRAK